jgi:hypothetical protein
LLLLLVLQPKKKVEKKYANKGAELDDTPLDDPIAERLRKQRLEEEADMRCVVCLSVDTAVHPANPFGIQSFDCVCVCVGGGGRNSAIGNLERG